MRQQLAAQVTLGQTVPGFGQEIQEVELRRCQSPGLEELAAATPNGLGRPQQLQQRLVVDPVGGRQFVRHADCSNADC